MSSVVFVPRLMDDAQMNPQNKNAQAILSRWRNDQCQCRTLSYDRPSANVAGNRLVDIQSLWRGRFWLADLFRQYLRPANLIFYPGGHPVEVSAMRLRRRLGGTVPIVATIEGLMGNQQLEKEYSDWAGHEVFCQYADDRGLERWDEIFSNAAHVIALSPFLARMGKRRYGDKFSVIQLGIDSAIFNDRGRVPTKRVTVISAGRVEVHKRPQLMLQLAAENPQVDFVWFGEGSLREPLMKQAAERQIENLKFPGALPPDGLASAMRLADIFVMPSMSEGVPKVTQEAAACGLAQVIFGFYEAPSVIDGVNGFVVWDDLQFIDRVGELIEDYRLTKRFGQSGADMAKDLWDWDQIAPQWERAICRCM